MSNSPSLMPFNDPQSTSIKRESAMKVDFRVFPIFIYLRLLTLTLASRCLVTPQTGRLTNTTGDAQSYATGRAAIFHLGVHREISSYDGAVDPPVRLTARKWSCLHIQFDVEN